MRLDFRNIGKGLVAIADAKKARDLAQESARYDVTEGAYGPGLQENIQQLQGLRERDPAQAAAYDEAIGVLQRRSEMTAPDYSVASGPTDFATRQEARQAAAPLRAEGLAGVYRQYGDVDEADKLEARAYEQQRAIAREARDVKAFDTAQAAAQQQGLLTGAQLTDIQRKQNLQAALDARLADINTQTFEKPEMRTQAVLSLVEELQGPQAAAQLRASYSQNELNDISLQAKKFDEGFRQSRAKGVIPALEWFDEQNTSFKLERDPKNPFRVIQVNTDGSRTLFADAKNERELGMIIDAKAKPGGWLELAKFDLDQKKDEAAIRASDATVGLRGAQAKQIRESADNANARADLIEKFEALTDEEKAGAKGQGIIKQFNLLNVKAGGTVPLGAAPRAATGPARELSDLDKENLRYYRDWVKDPKNAKLPQGQKDAFAAELGVTEFIKRGAAGPQAGIGSNPYAAPQQGVDTTRAPAPAAAPRPTPMRGPSDLSSVDIQKIRSDAATLDAAIAQVQAQASAVVRSGDTNAIKLYGDRLNALRAQRQALTAGLTGPAIQSVGLQ